MGTLLDGLARLKNISELRGLVETNKNRLQNFNTLWFRTAAENNATDPRDLVYGLLALLPAKLVQGVQIRYGTTTYQQVATDFTVNHIKTYNSLHWILFHPWHSFRDSQDWPSWMPNLGLPFNSAQFWSTIGGWQACSDIDASGELFQNEGTLLHCQGFKYDVIYTTTTPVLQEPEPSVHIWEKLPDILACFAKESHEEGMKYLDELWPDLDSLDHATSCKGRTQDDDATTRKRSMSKKEGSDHRYKSQQGLQDAFLACLQQLKLTTPDEAGAIFTIPINIIHDALLYQAVGFGSATKSAFISSRDTRIAYLSRFLRHNQDFSLNGAKLADCFEGPCSNKEAAEYLVEDRFPSFEPLDGMIPRIDQTSQVARMFTTGSGYLGVAMGKLQAGDEIHILKGCCMPAALRPSSRHVGAYEFLGGVFVHGIMHGEAVIDHQSRSGNLHRVTLC